MMNYSISLSILSFSLALLCLITRHKHILSMLLSLEMMMLSIFITLSSTMMFKTMENSMLLSFITLMVCEGGLGLSLLVIMSRLTGNTFINSTSIL